MRRASVSTSLLLVAIFLAAVPARAAAPATDTTTAKIRAAGVALDYPSQWVALPVTAKQLETQKKNLAKDPELLAETKRAIRSGAYKQIKFRAVGRSSDGVPQGVVVQVFEGQDVDPTLDGVIQIAEHDFEQVGGRAVNSGEVTPVGGKTAYRVDGKLPVTFATGTVDTIASVLLIPNLHGNTVMIEAISSDDDAGRAQVDDVLHSVRLR